MIKHDSSLRTRPNSKDICATFKPNNGSKLHLLGMKYFRILRYLYFANITEKKIANLRPIKTTIP